MKEVTVQIPDKDYPFFMELMRNLSFVKIVKAGKGASKSKLLSDLQGSIDELKQVKAGKKKARYLEDFLDEQ
ncbi:hypothetical protein HB364_32760 [Pseudoflavitalea sp. X16]|uniref:hypothetical protein n=1 Tax=Paraflavitalea devenefica TaxID=2716334 RepID=UPI00141DDB30|nr:hypothetical protein [Paraflavitalea devenefica]NII29896.1 hypothetical protein [Paraflavitalea devenefica]